MAKETWDLFEALRERMRRGLPELLDS